MRLLAQGSRQHRSPTDPGIHLVLAVHQTCADRRGAAARRLHGVCPRTEGGHALSLSFCRLLTRRQQVAFRRLKHGLSIELGLAATTGQQRQRRKGRQADTSRGGRASAIESIFLPACAQRPPSPWPTARGEKLHGRARFRPRDRRSWPSKLGCLCEQCCDAVHAFVVGPCFPRPVFVQQPLPGTCFCRDTCSSSRMIIRYPY